MIDTSESEKTCSPVLSYFVSRSRLASGCQITTQQGRLADTGERLESEDLVVQVLFSVFTAQIDSCNEKWEAIKKKRSEAGKKSGESRRSKSEQTRTKRTSVPFVEQTQTNANKSEQTRTKRTVTVTDTVTGTVTVPVTNKPPDGTAPNGAAPPANQEVGDVVSWSR